MFVWHELGIGNRYSGTDRLDEEVGYGRDDEEEDKANDNLAPHRIYYNSLD